MSDSQYPRRPGDPPPRALAVVRPDAHPAQIQAVPAGQAAGWPPCELLLDNVLRLTTNLHVGYDGPLADEPFHVSAFAGREYMNFSGRSVEQALRRMALAVRERIRTKQSGLVP